MPFYKFVVAYNGKDFHGSQRQQTTESLQAQIDTEQKIADQKKRKKPTSNKIPRTVQETLERAIVHLDETNTIQSIGMAMAGRTDKGVHARGQIVVANLKSRKVDDDAIPTNIDHLRQSINSRLPADVSIEHIVLLGHNSSFASDFHPRHHTVRKTYSYTIKFRRKVPGVDGIPTGIHTVRHALDDHTCLWVCPWALDDTQYLARTLEHLRGEHDFAAFCHKSERNNASARNHRMNLQVVPTVVSETKEDAPVVLLQLEFTAKGFGRQMIRNLVGFVVDVCRESVSDVPWDDIWGSGGDDGAQDAAANQLIHAAPAYGLCLESVELDYKDVLK